LVIYAIPDRSAITKMWLDEGIINLFLAVSNETNSLSLFRAPMPEDMYKRNFGLAHAHKVIL